jgi:hypothetical protein
VTYGAVHLVAATCRTVAVLVQPHAKSLDGQWGG